MLFLLYLNVNKAHAEVVMANHPCPEMRDPPTNTVYDCVPCGKGKMAVLYFKGKELFYRYYVLKGTLYVQDGKELRMETGEVTIEWTTKGKRGGVGGMSDKLSD